MILLWKLWVVYSTIWVSTIVNVLDNSNKNNNGDNDEHDDDNKTLYTPGLKNLWPLMNLLSKIFDKSMTNQTQLMIVVLRF